MKNISQYFNRGLCISCGICAGNCPVKCIGMSMTGYFVEPKVDNSACIGCGKCLRVCPNTEIGYAPDSSSEIEEYLLGNFTSIYCAKAKDKEWLKKCGSGGVASSLIRTLLECGDYDSAFCIGGYDYRNGNVKTERYTSDDDFSSTPRSRYLTINHEAAVSYMLTHRDERIILIGTPCAITGILNTISVNHLNRDNYLLLGLFCDKTMHYGVVDYFKSYPSNDREMTDFYFRTKEVHGWPGGVRICYDDETHQDLQNTERMKVKDYFVPERCLYCLDKLNRHADISLGDNYIAGNKDSEGQSSVIIRTEIGNRVWEKYKYLFDYHVDFPYDLIKSTALEQKTKNYYFGIIKGLHHKEESLPEAQLKQYNESHRKIAIGKNENAYDAVCKDLARKSDDNMRKKTFLRRVQERLSRYPKVKAEQKGKTFLIWGANFNNKGAQAMLFTAVSELRERFPDCKIFFNTKEKISEDYKFDVIYISQNELVWLNKNPVYFYLRLFAVFLIKHRFDIVKYHNLRKTFKSIDAVVDVSGYAFGSVWGYEGSAKYLLTIKTAQKYSVPVFLMPQSFGPFEFGEKQDLMDWQIVHTLSRVPKIFARENRAYDILTNKYGLNNVAKSYDLVLQNKEIIWGNISNKKSVSHIIQLNGSKNVAIIPNMRNLDRGGVAPQKMIKLYQTIISELVDMDFNVYLVRHSGEDIEACKNIYYSLTDKTGVTLCGDDYNCFEFNELIKQFCFVVASRYHSIVHSYKNHVPAIVLGWSEKYSELTSIFGQQQYMFDIVKPDEQAVMDVIKKMSRSYENESEKIAAVLPTYQQSNCFDCISEFFERE